MKCLRERRITKEEREYLGLNQQHHLDEKQQQQQLIVEVPQYPEENAYGIAHCRLPCFNNKNGEPPWKLINNIKPPPKRKKEKSKPIKEIEEQFWLTEEKLKKKKKNGHRTVLGFQSSALFT